MSQAVATLELYGQKVGTPRFPISVAVFAPMLAEPPNSFASSVQVLPFDAEARDIYGEGSMQALCLALRFAIESLARFVEQGGRLSYPEGDPFDLEPYGFRLPGES